MKASCDFLRWYAEKAAKFTTSEYRDGFWRFTNLDENGYITYQERYPDKELIKEYKKYNNN